MVYEYFGELRGTVGLLEVKFEIIIQNLMTMMCAGLEKGKHTFAVLTTKPGIQFHSLIEPKTLLHHFLSHFWVSFCPFFNRTRE